MFSLTSIYALTYINLCSHFISIHGVVWLVEAWVPTSCNVLRPHFMYLHKYRRDFSNEPVYIHSYTGL